MALKVLSALDAAKTQFYHFKAIIIAGMGIFTDAYNLFCIPPIMKLIAPVYYKNHPIPPVVISTVMVGIPLLGTVIGQLVFGWLGDRVGRRPVYGFALLLMVMSSIGCGFSICRERHCVLGSLAFFRFLLGVGIGGDYPLSATIMSEFANKRTRGAFIAAVFSMQGFGILASSMVTMAVCAIFQRMGNVAATDPTPEEADVAWRVILMLGAVPASLTFYWRMMMPETARYTALVQKNVFQATKDMEKVLAVPLSQISEHSPLPSTPQSYSIFSKTFVHRHGRDLFACASTWFLVDVVFYSNNLFQPQITHEYFHKANATAYEEAINIAKLQAFVAGYSTIPGYFSTVFLIDKMGRVKIQVMGFFFMAIVYFAIGIPYYSYWVDNTNVGFMFLYGLTFFFSNFGPNTTTFIVPAELFPARFRSTCHGISGAAGKVGAIFGSIGYSWASHRQKEDGYPKGIGMTASLLSLGGICILGMVITNFFTRETMGRSLEENETDENDEQCLLRCFTDCSVRSNSSINEVPIA